MSQTQSLRLIQASQACETNPASITLAVAGRHAVTSAVVTSAAIPAVAALAAMPETSVNGAISPAATAAPVQAVGQPGSLSVLSASKAYGSLALKMSGSVIVPRTSNTHASLTSASMPPTRTSLEEATRLASVPQVMQMIENAATHTGLSTKSRTGADLKTSPAPVHPAASTSSSKAVPASACFLTAIWQGGF